MNRVLELLSINEDDSMTIHEIVESTGIGIKECREIIEQIRNSGIKLSHTTSGYYLSQPYRLYNGKYVAMPVPNKKAFDLQIGDKIVATLRWWDNPYRSKKTVVVDSISDNIFVCKTDKGIKCAFQKKDYEYSFVLKV